MNLFPLVSRRFVVGAPNAIAAFDYYLDFHTEIAYLSCAAEGGQVTPPPGVKASTMRVSFEGSSFLVKRAASEMLERANLWLQSCGIDNDAELWGYDAGYFVRCIEAEIHGLEMERVIKIKRNDGRTLIPRKKTVAKDRYTSNLCTSIDCNPAVSETAAWLPSDQRKQFAFDFA